MGCSGQSKSSRYAPNSSSATFVNGTTFPNKIFIEDIYSFDVNTINIFIECDENISFLNVFIIRDENLYDIH